MRRVTVNLPCNGATCEICASKIDIKRTYFHYDNIRCICHDVWHYERIDHCDACSDRVEKPVSTTVLMYTEELSELRNIQWEREEKLKLL